MKTTSKVLLILGIVIFLAIICLSIFLPSLGRARESNSRVALNYPPNTIILGDNAFFCKSGTSGGYNQNKSAQPGTMPDLSEEVWVIAKASGETQPAEQESPGSGALLAKTAEDAQEIPVPLKHTDVKATVAGYIATVEVTQQFHNPFSEKIEASYVFPLPENAAVNEFIMTIGERKIRGIIREREEAEKIYEQARQQGYTASLLTQERPNIFTQKVANIEPGRQIDVAIKYFHTLAYVDGGYEFVMPMVVGPRFNPPDTAGGVGAVARGQTGSSGQKTEVQYLKPGERSGHDIALSVEIDAGAKIENITSRSHVITQTPVSPSKVIVQLSSLDTIPNKDFVLRYQVAGDHVKTSFLTQHNEQGDFFTLILYPPQNLDNLKRSPMEMIFVLDNSGSMNGEPIAKSKEAVRRGLRQLQPDDTFQIIEFSMNASQLGSAPLPATQENIRKGLKYIEQLRGGGGTMMIEGIKAALDFPHDPKRLRLVGFLTDGYIGNEAEILAAIQQKLGASRIFSFGVGSSVNRYLLDSMAKIGRGAVAYIGLNDPAADIMDQFYQRISHPALTDVAINWNAMQVSEVYPKNIPDLFVGRAVIVTGRYQGQGVTALQITGKTVDIERTYEIPVSLNDTAAGHPGIAAVWARKKIAELSYQNIYQPQNALVENIKQLALQFNLMSDYTAFVAVDSSHVTAGDHGISVAVPVPVPDGVRYETTVQE